MEVSVKIFQINSQFPFTKKPPPNPKESTKGFFLELLLAGAEDIHWAGGNPSLLHLRVIPSLYLSLHCVQEQLQGELLEKSFPLY